MCKYDIKNEKWIQLKADGDKDEGPVSVVMDYHNILVWATSKNIRFGLEKNLDKGDEPFCTIENPNDDAKVEST